MPTQAEKCLEIHGYTNPIKLSIACQCKGCNGELRADGIGATGAVGFLVCSVCICTYTIPANKEIRR